MYELNIPDLDIAKIAESGQCFRMTALGDAYRVIAFGRALRVRQRGSRIEFDCGKAEFDALWARYFDLDTDYAAIERAAGAGDPYLRRALEASRGVRILRQEPWEMLVTSILTQRRSIPAIRGCVETLCARFGAPITDGAFTFPTTETLAGEGEDAPIAGRMFAFPTAETLSGATEEALRACSMGYRAPYVREAALRGLDMDALAALPDAELLDALTALPGVGPKVASCAMLFGFHRLDAFPRDVWINRALADGYPDGFPFERYKGCAGVIQQYLFYYARSMGRSA